MPLSHTRPSRATSSWRAACRGAVVAVLLAAVASCDGAPSGSRAAGVVGVLQTNPDYSTVARLAEQTGLLATLGSGGPYTVLAPTDIAFPYVGADALPVLLDAAQRDILRRVLRHHVVPGVLTPDDFQDGTVLTSLEGVPLHVRRVRNEVIVDGATINIRLGAETDNGVVYPASNLNRTNLTVRERIELAPMFAQFRSLADRIGLLDRIDALEEKTILVPINDAFEAEQETVELLLRAGNADVLSKLLRLYVLPGTVDLGALPAETDVATLNGPTVRVATRGNVTTVDGRPVLGPAVQTEDGRIYLVGDILVKNLTLDERLRILPGYDTIVRNLQAETDLWGRVLSPTDPITIFAPSDAVYRQQSANVRQALAQVENLALLTRTRRVHVVEGRYDPDDLVDGQVLEALDGTPLTVRRGSGTLSVGGQVVTPVEGSITNGALYTTDAFIRPRVDPFDSAILQGLTAFARAVRVADLESIVREESLTIFAPTNSLFQNVPSLIADPELREILLYQMSRERLPYAPEIEPPVQPFTVLTGNQRAFARRTDPETGEYIGPILLDALIPVPAAGPISYDGRTRFFLANQLLYLRRQIPEPPPLM